MVVWPLESVSVRLACSDSARWPRYTVVFSVSHTTSTFSASAMALDPLNKGRHWVSVSVHGADGHAVHLDGDAHIVHRPGRSRRRDSQPQHQYRAQQD